jgi:O6-methylguanine-DNA--protein-cysteine methyltransferase
VIRNDGSLGGYGQGIERKIALLEMEGTTDTARGAAAG